MLSLCRLMIFSKLFFLKNYFRNTIRVSKSMYPDQARRYDGPDLGTKCLQRLSVDDSSRQRIKELLPIDPCCIQV